MNTPPLAHKIIIRRPWVPAANTNIAETFKRVREQQAKEATRQFFAVKQPAPRPTFQHFDSPEALARHLQYLKDNAATLEF